jgi:hypothetical protein
MLKEIKCNHFQEKSIKFSNGLNTVLGDNFSTNSIGKSTLLMIIDFVFGGNSFLSLDSGSIKVLGDLSFEFKFEFKSQSFYYTRTTKDPGLVSVCDKDYNFLSEISITQFTDNLKEKYQIENKYLTFRSIVGLYSRIWGKENYNVNKPLQSFLKDKEPQAIMNLIKLFNLYDSIAETEIKIKNQEDSKKVIEGIHKKNYIQKVTKTQFKKNQFDIEQIQKEIFDIKENLLQFTLNIEGLVSEEMIELKTEKTKLLEGQSTTQNKIRRLELNLERKSVKSKYFNKLSSFFENTNQDKIEEIETFHNKIGTILKKELTEAKKLLSIENQSFNNQIEKIDFKISNLLENVQSPSFIVEKLYDLTIESNKLETVNKFHQEKEDVVTEIETLNTSLQSTISIILKEIQEKINSEIIKINNDIHTKENKSPKLILLKKTYSFDHSGDTGTGKSFSNLIEFDLVILKLTSLPFIIHDSPLFKNIGDLTFEKIIEKYSSIEKQIFISVDGINKYSEGSIKILEDKKVIQLTDSKQLFDQDWRVKGKK